MPSPDNACQPRKGKRFSESTDKSSVRIYQTPYLGHLPGLRAMRDHVFIRRDRDQAWPPFPFGSAGLTLYLMDMPIQPGGQTVSRLKYTLTLWRSSSAISPPAIADAQHAADGHGVRPDAIVVTHDENAVCLVDFKWFCHTMKWKGLAEKPFPGLD